MKRILAIALIVAVALLTCGATASVIVLGAHLFVVDKTGNITRIRGVAYSWPASQGEASTYLRNDGAGALTWTAVAGGSGTPSATVVTETAFGQASTAGAATSYSRGDHTHGTPAAPASDPWTYYRKTSNQTNATTTLASITELGHSLLASKDYEMECRLIVWSSVTTTGVQPSVLGPASPTEIVWHARVPYTATTEFLCHYNAYSTKCAALTALTTGRILTIWAIVRNGANTGTLTPQFAAETTGTVTVGTGSVCKYRQTN